MEKREVAVYLYLGVLIVAAILAIYFFNVSLTGFAIFEQNSKVTFDEGTYENVFYDENTSSVVLETNKTSGEYISKIFDSGSNNSVLNNLTWTGTGSLTFEIMDCTSVNCSGSSFAVPADLNNLSLTGQYFQYKVLFDTNGTNETLSLSSVSLGYSTPAPPVPETLEITLSQPSGIKYSETGISMGFTITGGTNHVCWYNIRDASDNALITPQVVSLDNCSNVSFDVGTGDGDYIFTLFVDSSLGVYNKTSDFSIRLPSSEAETEAETTTTETESTTQVFVQPPPLADLSLQAIEKITLKPSDSSNFNLVTKNIGNVALSGCILTAGGDYASWLSIPETSQNMNTGETKNFSFSMKVPGDAKEGAYAFSLSVQCAETMKNLQPDFSVNIEKKKIDFNITKVERTRTDRVVVSYSLKELANQTQNVSLQFLLHDASNAEIGNATTNQTIAATKTADFKTNIAINGSLSADANLTLLANINSEKYSVSVNEPIKLGTPTGFFVMGEQLGTTGNVFAIVILLAIVIGVFFFFKSGKFSRKNKPIAVD